MHSGLAIWRFPMAYLQLILELLSLHIRAGCSLMVFLLFLMLVGACCFYLSASLWCVLHTELHIGTKLLKLHNVLSGRNAIFFRRWLHNSTVLNYTRPKTFNVALVCCYRPVETVG